MAFNPANKQLTYRGSNQAKCTLCGLDVAWYRPKGSEVWCGVVSMSDVTEMEMEAHTNPTTGKVTHRIVAVAVAPASSLHACHPCNQKYTDVHLAARTGTLKPKTRPEGAPAYRGPRRKRRAAVVTAPAPTTVPYVSPAMQKMADDKGIPLDTRSVALPDPTPIATATTRVKSTVPDPALPPHALKAWERARRIIEETDIHRLNLWGPPGTGKTSFPHRLAEAKGWGIYSKTTSEELPAAGLIGQFVLKATPTGGEVRWLDGPATRAFRESHDRPTLLVLNEVDHASGDCMTAMIEIMDDPNLVALYLPTGEVIKPKPGNIRIIATSNAEPSALLSAVQDRLHVSVLLTHPNPGIIASLYSREAKLLLTAASREYSVRAILSWDSLMRNGLTLQDAAELVFEPDVASSLIDAARLLGSAV